MKTLPFFLLNIQPRVQNRISHDGYSLLKSITYQRGEQQFLVP